MQSHNANKRHSIYRAYSADKELLYVGCTCKGIQRLHQHAVAEWWSEVAFLSVEHAENMEAALLIEARAIETEHPRCNRARPIVGGWGERDVAAARDAAASLVSEATA